MNKKFNFSFKREGKNLFILFFIFIFGLIYFFSIPFIYDFLFGDMIIEKHIDLILGDKRNHNEAVPILLGWLKGIHYPKDDEAIFIFGNDIGIYWIDDSLRYFYRAVPVSWTITLKIGRCGEAVDYFVTILDRLGYRTRKIVPLGWDHTWAEYFTEEGEKIIVSPAEFKFIDDPAYFVNGHNFTDIIAIDLNGTAESVVSDYLKK